jgi:hypothetical protein
MGAFFQFKRSPKSIFIARAGTQEIASEDRQNCSTGRKQLQRHPTTYTGKECPLSRTSTMNIHFAKNNQTRFVKHGFSWQIFFFGPIAFLMRSQFLLAAACAAAMYATFMLMGLITIMVFDLDLEPARFLGVAAACSLVGYFGNRFSARSYVKNGWTPVSEFPADWNVPQLITPEPADTQPG